MYKEIYQLYKDNSNKKFSSNQQFIYDLFIIMKTFDVDLNDYLVDLKFNDNQDQVGSYNINTGITFINFNDLCSSECSNKTKYLKAILTLRHELEHARSLKIFNEQKNDLESTITKYCFKTYPGVYPFTIMVGEEDRDYLFNPLEKIARIKSSKFLVNLFKNNRESFDLKYARSELLESYYRGYIDNGCYLNAPTYQYLLNNEMYQELSMIKKYVDSINLSLDARLLCGLPVSYNEYKYDIPNKARVNINQNL